MDNIISNFTTTTGRINRQPFWIGVIVLVVISIVIYLLTSMIAPAAITWVSLIVSVLLAFPYYALAVKRRHDKDNAGLDVLIFIALNVVFSVIAALGLGYTATEVAGTTMMMPGTLNMIFSVVVLIYAIYLLVVLGFLKGTSGPNQYGPDPLGGA